MCLRSWSGEGRGAVRGGRRRGGPQGPEQSHPPPLTVLPDHVQQVIRANVVDNDAQEAGLLSVVDLPGDTEGAEAAPPGPLLQKLPWLCPHTGWGQPVSRAQGFALSWAAWKSQRRGLPLRTPIPTLMSKLQLNRRTRAMKTLLLDGGAWRGRQALAGLASTRRPCRGGRQLREEGGGA